MKTLSHRTRAKILIYLACFVLIAHIHAIPRQVFPFLGFTYLAFGVLTLFWIRSIERRILQRSMRRCLIAGASLLLVLYMNTLMWTQYFEGLMPLTRWLWYLDYAPLILASTVMFLASLCVSKDEKWQMPGRVYLLFLPAILIAVLCCTNDLHGWAYSFQDPTNLETATRGGLYYLAAFWMGSMIILSYVVVIRHCVLSSARKLAWVPFLPLLVELLYFIIFIYLDKHFQGRDLVVFGYQEIFGFMFVGFWESCIQIGLVPSNSDYEALFDVSTIASFLTNERGEVRRRSAAAGTYTQSQLEIAREKPLLVDENTKLSSFPITGGTAYWTADLTRENRILNSLRETKEQLSEEQTLLAAENKIAEDRARILAQSRLYDEIAEGVEERLYRLEALLSEGRGNPLEDRQNLRLRLLYGAYIKRRANLCILAEKNERTPVEELRLSIKESMDALRLMDIACDVRVRREQLGERESEHSAFGEEPQTPSHSLERIFDFYQEVCERTLPVLSAMMVTIVPGSDPEPDRLTLRFSLESRETTEELERCLWELVSEGDLAPDPEVTCVLEDETLFLTAEFRTFPEDYEKKRPLERSGDPSGDVIEDSSLGYRREDGV